MAHPEPNDLRSTIASYVNHNNPDEIEKAIVIALLNAGQTTNRRAWYRPTAIAVHGFAFAARASAGMGFPEGALLGGILYGVVDVFGFSGTIKLVAAMLKKQKAKKSPPRKGPKENAGETAS